ncbi:MAG: class I SAM-dependent methyltransferase [Methylobacterium sp.]|uniref:class I SAM-dependent methyltransferase n=1 Tax=Methylobacterium sp. TaxID=409 RepID=UPI002586364A|nr:class I SAM-dependent methyltransferase [Methylobacterium sp.]MBY0299325.1 class I SAM-dependent methyltransferase [Methylobacterium sp.]
MARFHFVEDYERVVRKLVKRYPLDEAMRRAVGGDLEAGGAVERAVVRHAGLKDGDALIDFGCGAGRLAMALRAEMRIDYLGIDVVETLLRYARGKCPDYRFVRNHALSIPAPDASADMVSAFSVFTHLLHAETYIYLEDMHRVLRPGGRVVFSFLEFAKDFHWAVFDDTVTAQKRSTVPHLNQFIERNAIEVWAKRLGYASVGFISGEDAPWPDAPALGQSIAILHKGG